MAHDVATPRKPDSRESGGVWQKTLLKKNPRDCRRGVNPTPRVIGSATID